VLGRVTAVRGSIAVATGLLLTGVVVAYSDAAGAAPQPTVSQVQAQVNSIQAKLDRIDQQYDQISQQLSKARGRLTSARRTASQAQSRFDDARISVARIAAATYEESGQNSMASLLASGDPSAVLGRASMLLQLAGSRKAQIVSYLADAQQLTGAQQKLQRTAYGIAALKTKLAGEKTSLGKLLASKQAALASLTAQQQAAVAAAAVGAGGTTTAVYTGPTTTQADKAVAFAYAQLGKPYVWGATGPGSYDCSGLVQAAWAAVGVSIPRVTYDQWAALPHISSSSIQPGDLLFYNGESHVAIYVGGGYIIDAPRTGLDVEKIPMNTGWYAQTFDGAVRP